jgi:putative transposase
VGHECASRQFIVMVEFAHFNRDEEEFPMTEDRLLIEELAAGQPVRTIAENVLQLIMTMA